MYSRVAISFDIFMPQRLQKKYLLRKPPIQTENFRVLVVYSQVMPLALVHYFVAAGEDQARQLSPSSAVIFVRKYLEEKLANHATVDFQMLGPSPFHADLFLTPDAGSEDDVDATKPGDGYSTLILRVEGSTPSERVADFLRRHAAVLGVFYEAIAIRLQSGRLAARVVSRARALLERPPGNIWRRFQRWRSLRGRIDKAFSALLEEKMHQATVHGFVARVQEDREVDQTGIFYQFVEREIELRSHLPSEDIREALVMLEERRRGYFETSATLFSGLAGGIIGAVMGAAATFWLNPPAPSVALAPPIERSPVATAGPASQPGSPTAPVEPAPTK